MAGKQLDAEALCAQIQGLADATTKETLTDVLATLEDFLQSGPTGDDVDTWECGARAMIEVIRANYVTE